jgi:hypothetical protein
MSFANALGADNKLSLSLIPTSLLTRLSALEQGGQLPEGLAQKIEALEEFARLIAEVVAIQLEDGSTYQYTGLPQNIQPIPVLTMAEVVKEPEDPSVEEAEKK